MSEEFDSKPKCGECQSENVVPMGMKTPDPITKVMEREGDGERILWCKDCNAFTPDKREDDIRAAKLVKPQ